MIRWTDGDQLLVDDEVFLVLQGSDNLSAAQVSPAPSGDEAEETGEEAVVVWKDRPAVEQFIERVTQVGPDGNIVELGVHQGGSVALLARVARPRRLVTVDQISSDESRLDGYIERNDLGDIIRPYWNLDQGDRVALRRAMVEEFGTSPLDLVIDDASHEYAETRASFEVLFPRLRPGGAYLIEDWTGVERGLAKLAPRLDADTDPHEAAMLQSWALALTTALREPDHYRHAFAVEMAKRGHREAFAVGPEGAPPDHQTLADLAGRAAQSESARYVPLTHLVLQLILIKAAGDVIGDIKIGPLWTEIERGPADLDPDTFDLADHLFDYFGSLSH